MDKKSLIAMGTGLALSLAMSASYADSNTMQATQMGSGQFMQKADGQCGAGKCGANKMGTQQKNMDGASADSMGNKADRSCGANMKDSDGACGSNMKDSDGSCGASNTDQ
ncbi:HvfA family oxazolone/thioamide-modified RiPP metallophore [Caedibacter taeniospiralis]|jgi:uncharacterized low-complexity protein|uniref:HvfA family oxazolone/thioamide-modified RiPP metallophore n=1 Tax=Caedibacter taeniospiralis TaxID=28907 RepID=UPI000C273FC1|nr:hypothetical protein [Caedibacter taeniospiralis]